MAKQASGTANAVKTLKFGLASRQNPNIHNNCAKENPATPPIKPQVPIRELHNTRK